MDGSTRPPAWYWIVAVLVLLWEATGCFFYVVQVRMGPAELAQLPPAQAEAFAAMATWQWAAFATAVWVGLAGAIGLLLRRRWASLAFWISLIAAAIQYGYTFFATDPAADAGERGAARCPSHPRAGAGVRLVRRLRGEQGGA